MTQEIKTLDFGGANCYLVRTYTGYILIDTGFPAKRNDLERELESAGCKPGNLELVILTHGDHDHAGNCAYLREKYGARIAMHKDDAKMAERGDMGWNRKAKPDKISMIFRITGSIAGRLFEPGKFGTFEPDLTIDESYDLSPYSFDAKVLHLPRHSKGSIGILTAGGDLFCGDLLANDDKPGLNSIMDDSAAANASVAKLKGLEIKTVYPGHGEPFPMDLLMKNHRKNNKEQD